MAQAPARDVAEIIVRQKKGLIFFTARQPGKGNQVINFSIELFQPGHLIGTIR